MALPIRALARALMPQYAKKGMSTRAITKDLQRRFGSAYRRATLVADYREFTGMVKHAFAVERLGDNIRPSSNIITNMAFKRLRRYRLIAESTFIDSETGADVKRIISWYTNLSGTKADWIDEYISKTAPTAYEEGAIPVQINIFVIQHHEDMPY